MTPPCAQPLDLTLWRFACVSVLGRRKRRKRSSCDERRERMEVKEYRSGGQENDNENDNKSGSPVTVHHSLSSPSTQPSAE